jgi:hypothetical protein
MEIIRLLVLRANDEQGKRIKISEELMRTMVSGKEDQDIYIEGNSPAGPSDIG